VSTHPKVSADRPAFRRSVALCIGARAKGIPGHEKAPLPDHEGQTRGLVLRGLPLPRVVVVKGHLEHLPRL
jgi:hypothetical protein